ncbi:MAG: hypothetical protein R3231_07680 [bacterium]|nr:hypothetical protein [bacterium]
MEAMTTWIAAAGFHGLITEIEAAGTGLATQFTPSVSAGFSAEPLRMLALGVILLLLARYGRKGP